MFLYDKNDSFIDIYKLEPKIEEIKRYRKDQMEKDTHKKIFWVAQSNNINHNKLEKIGNLVEYDRLNYKSWLDGTFAFVHSFRTSKKRKQNEQYLKHYYDDEEFKYRLCKMCKDSDINYILFLKDKYQYSMVNYPNDTYIMDGIINIPESLYLLEALLRGKINLLGNCDISEQLSLFDIQFVERISCDMLENLCNYNFFVEPYNSIVDKTQQNENVIKLVRKINR